MEGSDKVTIRDVAVEAGVAVSTVSRTINHPSKVSRRTRKRVVDVIQDLNYTPSEAAKHLGRKRAEKKRSESAEPFCEDIEGMSSPVIFEGKWTRYEQFATSEAFANRDEEGPWLCVKSELNEKVFFFLVHIKSSNSTLIKSTFNEFISQIRLTIE